MILDLGEGNIQALYDSLYLVLYPLVLSLDGCQRQILLYFLQCTDWSHFTYHKWVLHVFSSKSLFALFAQKIYSEIYFPHQH